MRLYFIMKCRHFNFCFSMFDNFILQQNPLYFGNKYYELYFCLPFHKYLLFILFQLYGNTELSTLRVFILSFLLNSYINYINYALDNLLKRHTFNYGQQHQSLIIDYELYLYLFFRVQLTFQ